MTLPQLSHDEFKELAGAYAPVPLILQSFEAEDVLRSEPITAGLRVFFMGVKTTHMYMQENGKPALVMPSKGVDYDDIESVYPVKDAWAYTVSEAYDVDVDDRSYFFRDGNLPLDGKRKLAPFKLGEVATH